MLIYIYEKIMASNTPIYSIAKDLNIDSNRILQACKSIGINAKGATKRLNKEELEKVKNYFETGKNVSLAQDRFNDAISEIDKSISHLQKTKDALLVSKKHLLSADSKSQDLTVKKLTKNNPTMKKKFNDLRNDEDLK